MKKSDVINIIIAGTGGQGVVTLSNIIRKLANANDYKCEGATFKGGAQRMGSVYSELRIKPRSTTNDIFSSQIPKGEVDVLIGLEPWETLRFANHCNQNTKVISNSKEEKLYVERMDGSIASDSITKLKDTFNNLLIDNYSEIALSESGSTKNTNLIILIEALKQHYLQFTLEQLELEL